MGFNMLGGGPCPPTGKHRYFHKLYALDRTLEFHRPPIKVQLEAAMRGHISAKTELVGLYEKGPLESIESLVSGLWSRARVKLEHAGSSC
jgi:Phosphatidylethanolamine-binding protein